MVSRPGIQDPRPDWVPLFRAPYAFRKTISFSGQYQEGTSDQEFIDQIQEPLSAGRAQQVRFSFLPEAVHGATFYVESVGIAHPSKSTINPEYLTVEDRDTLFHWMPKSEANSYALRLYNAWNKLVMEFRTAVRADVCRVWARYNGPTADFAAIPSDVFGQVVTIDWTDGRAHMPDGVVLWSIHVAESEHSSATSERKLAGRERQALYRMIYAALARGRSDIDLDDGALIRKFRDWADNCGVSLDDATVRKHLPEIRATAAAGRKRSLHQQNKAK